MIREREIGDWERGPVMVAILEPGLAWMVIATEEGATTRRQAGYLEAGDGED